MDLSTTYLGLKLKNPVLLSASPMTETLDGVKRAEDAGLGGIVLHSLFEEQLILDREELDRGLTRGTESFAEALSYFPQAGEYRLGPEEYLEHIAKAKAAVQVPIIASLNGTSTGGWIDYARKIQQAGADALELNIYYIPTDLNLTAQQVEQTYLDILRAVKSVATIPVAVKLSPFFSSLGNMAKKLDEGGANGLVLFNRFYQPEINLETLEVEHSVLLSTPQARRLPMRWIAILYGRIKADLAATSGIHNAQDVIRMLMVGAKVTMLCSVFYKMGLGYAKTILAEMVRWMEQHEYESVSQMIGCLSQKNCPDPSAYERAQYMRILTSWRPAAAA
jgi:dihydroorotate dehydrogenase (fumarate)